VCPWLSSMHNKQYKDFPVYLQKECCFQVFMSGFEIRDFGLFVKQSRLKHFQHGRKRVNIMGYPVLVSWHCITKYIYSGFRAMYN
jgi:hypothetical protein